MSLAKDMMYPADFWTGLVASLVYIGVQLLFFWLIFRESGVEYLAGYNLWQIYFVYGVYSLVTSVIFLFIIESSWLFVDGIDKGLLDLDLIKPISSFFGIFFKCFVIIINLINVLFSIVIIAWLLFSSKIDLSITQLIMVGAIIFQSILLYGILYIISAVIQLFFLKFWVLRIIMHEFDIVTTYPRKIYPGMIRFVLLFIWPFFMIVNPVFDVFDHTVNWEKIASWMGVTIIFFLVLALMWINGLKRYCSTG